jgi:hypothetical protein
VLYGGGVCGGGAELGRRRLRGADGMTSSLEEEAAAVEERTE